MRAAVLEGPGRIVVRSFEEPWPGPRDLVVRVRCAGICGTDLALWSGDYAAEYPLVPGHEFCGVVEAIGEEVEGRFMGAFVTSEISLSCLTRREPEPCAACRDRMPSHCLHRRVLGLRGVPGAFAERVLIPAGAAHILPEGLSPWAGAAVEPVAAAMRTFEVTPIEADQTVVVLGAGRLGLLVTRIATSYGAKVIAASRSKEKRDLALRFGASEALDASSDGLADAVRVRTGGLGAHLVVECTGHPRGPGLALSLVRAGGTVALKSTPGRPAEGFDPTEVVVKEIRIQGSRCGPYDKAIERLAAGRIPVDDFVAGTFSLDEIETAFEAARHSGKVLIEFPEPDDEECGHHHG
ncbi:MAG: alcohol dehydrogenase catalytic domain-containing protein [Planctomycetota bacterium]